MTQLRKLEPADGRSDFGCGDRALDAFLRNYAGQHQKRHVSVTYVAAQGPRVIGFVTVAAGTMTREDIGSAARRLPSLALPILLLARLGVDSAAQGRGLGKHLLRHALVLARSMSSTVGCVGAVVDAKTSAVAFYERLGFARIEAPLEPSTIKLFIPITAIPADPAGTS